MEYKLDNEKSRRGTSGENKYKDMVKNRIREDDSDAFLFSPIRFREGILSKRYTHISFDFLF